MKKITSIFSGVGVGEHTVVSEDARVLYLFSNESRQLRTVDTVTGQDIYSFAYDTQGHLISVADLDGDITRIERDSEGQPTGIVAPDGQRTTLTLDANGYLASITNPAGEAHRIAYTADGLMTQFTDPKGNINRFEYDSVGRLLRDTNAGLGGWIINRTENAAGYTNTMTTAEGRTTAFTVEPLTTGDRKQVNTYPDGTVQTKLFKTNGEETTTRADGTIVTVLQGPDPRFGMQAPIPGTARITLPSGLTSTATTTRTAPLSNANDLLSLTILTETTTVNGQPYTNVFDKASLTYTNTSPAGRVTTSRVNNKRRPALSTVANLFPVGYAYDARGRLSRIEQGIGTHQRTSLIGYNAQGYVDTLTDALNRNTTFEYDLAGRVTRQTLPDGRKLTYSYDANGNLTSLIPPGQPAHLLDYTALDQEKDYTPPSVDIFDPATRYQYNRDKQLEVIIRPDGQTLDFGYQASSGQLTTLILPSGVYAYDYSPTTGQLTRLTAPDGGQLGYTYDGFLLKDTTWTGVIASSVSRGYNNNLKLSELKVNGQNPIAFQYDRDQLLTQAGSLILTRSAQNGLITGTSLGQLTDTLGYSGFGEMSAYTAKVNGAEVFATGYTRDALGRITRKQETVQGVTHTRDYAYDPAGRLIEVKRDGVVQATYGYDDNGNRTTLNGQPIASYDDQDRLLAYDGNTYGYTANGELQSKTEGAFTTTYEYDVLGNLRKVTNSFGTVIDYLIDGQNRKIGKQVNTVLIQGFLYQDGLKPIAELTATTRSSAASFMPTRPTSRPT